MNEHAFYVLYFSAYLWVPFVAAIIHSAGWMDLAPKDGVDILVWVLLPSLWPLLLVAFLAGALGAFLVYSIVGMGNAIGKELRREQD